MELKVMERNSPGCSDSPGVWDLFDNVVTKNYLTKLADAVVKKSPDGFGKALSKVSIDHITKIVYDRDEDNLAKLKSVFSALYSAGTSAFILLRNQNKITEFYIGINANDPGSAIKVFERAMAGNFPGCAKDELDSDQRGELCDCIRDERHNSVGVVTGVPSLKSEDSDSFTQGLEKIIEAMGDREYVALLLGTPVSRDDLNRIAVGYENIYSNLSLLNVNGIAVNEQNSKAIGKTITEGFSSALTKSIAQTTTVSDGTSSSTTHTHTEGVTETKGKSKTVDRGFIGGAIAGAIGGTCVGGPILGVVGGVVGGIAGSLVGSPFGAKATYQSSTAKTSSDSIAQMDGTNHSESYGTTISTGMTNTRSSSEASSETDTVSSGVTYQYGLKNRGIEEALKIVDVQIDRIKAAKDFGAWNWAAYFVAPDPATVQIGTHIYSGILRGENSGLERNAVAIWGRKDPQYADIIDALSKFQHPIFEFVGIQVMPTTLVGTAELAVGMAFPQKSLPGVPVFDSVEFGRAVTTYDKQSDDQVEIGDIFHLGAKESRKVCIDVQTLTSHMFVTGSTGSGKSNFLYSLLTGLRMDHGAEGKGVRFLVVEPAKGEYKSVLGGMRGVHVFGTNPYETELLRINPFAFPAQIHIMEHIDRLIEILNAAWPMYAAMPAILKDAVECTYKKLGWDLVKSTCRSGGVVFPDFNDLLKVLPEVINSSAYDAEVKSNYSGALLTRVKALTNGYYRMILQKDEIDPRVLFDESCIVDISRVGSSETKSLLMGIVFLKLQEYRMANAVGHDLGLRHITILEEAHNLLRKTNTDQGMETANLAGKSVEMMTNAIAEMRTYGEAFVIADQAPGLLDPAVIRNTNTKVVFRLPDYDDRVLVGKSENLTEEQINELARLPKGCASVFQNNWLEAVLCMMPKYTKSFKEFEFKGKIEQLSDSRSEADSLILKLIVSRASKGLEFKKIISELTDHDLSMLQMYYPNEKLLQNCEMTEGDLLDDVYRRITKVAMARVVSVPNRTEWTTALLSVIYSSMPTASLSDDEKDELSKLVFKSLARYDKNPEQVNGWLEQIDQISKWRVWA